jgi:serine/threonine protein kinase
MAPEIQKKQDYDEKCDIWSLGIIIYKMLFGEYPFMPKKGRESLLEQILK